MIRGDAPSRTNVPTPHEIEALALIISPRIQPGTLSWETAHQAASRVFAYLASQDPGSARPK